MLSKVLGPKTAQLTKSWIPTVATWGAVGGMVLLFATDWKLIVGRIPYIRGKFKDE
ncbi:cytochrome b-c1 complex subunit 10 [Callorhinchus milii]|uniref:Methyl-CpG binding domain protein 3a n=1 Tax=Callorhinchus milii TaxID=7868 RepID=K4GAB3_CALMI|nr:cytochrome b-c1 complex subunit 10 [Callorhinchus milii]AFK10832.1 putative ubiquinol-cytochrome c reductase [Callorhinchus milii]AFM85878.1 putative ubiquinol-cytochrome c reductase [Callorhinchus milii]AFM86475.1 putative ubiquinol-cytochrome c reductase [Callorhinchus milii]AFM87606.1 putative ubiquinol-cytochrome c reductase [Callorhinchus milii]|eukprot:gi/632982879/ref/XP_007908372.1/ PREDICTED: cytochrome b-c1 complex subunit 10 [Callorhinchus milii]